MSDAKVPVVAYHSIADDHDHLVHGLSMPVAFFENQLRHLAKRGFATVTLHDVHAFLKEGRALPPRTVVLTFDDGYLDNWVYVFPLLKKYGMKATIFMITDFIDPAEQCRPNLEDVWSGKIAPDELSWWGHLSWPELERMQESGHVDIQAHTKTHTWHFKSDRIVDFHHPRDEYHWLYWNLYPEKKPGWLTEDFRTPVPWGTPVYDFSQTLLNPRYFEDPSVAEAATSHVSEHGGENFFAKPDWREDLRAALETRCPKDKWAGRLETKSEYEQRLTEELVGSRDILERRLGKPVEFVCWPCGEYTEALQRFAIDSGYLATVSSQHTSNRYGDDPTEVRRIYFGQDYKGPFRSALIQMHFCGNVNYHSGVTSAFLLAPLARRLMMVGNFFRRR